MEEIAERVSRAATRIVTKVDAHARNNRSIYTLIALLLFLVGISVSLTTTPISLERLRPSPFLVNMLIGAPAALGVNALSLMISARILSLRVGFKLAFQTCSIASAASVLPIPASTYIHTTTLTRSGGSALASGGITVLANLALFTLLMMASGLAWVPSAPILGIVLSVCGLGSSLAIWLLIAKISNLRIATLFLLLRASRAAILLGRLWLSFLMIGTPVNIIDAAVFSLAVSIGTSVSIVPAGLGISESLASIIAGTVGIDPAIAFIATASNRLVTLVASGILALFFLRHRLGGA